MIYNEDFEYLEYGECGKWDAWEIKREREEYSKGIVAGMSYIWNNLHFEDKNNNKNV